MDPELPPVTEPKLGKKMLILIVILAVLLIGSVALYAWHAKVSTKKASSDPKQESVQTDAATSGTKNSVESNSVTVDYEKSLQDGMQIAQQHYKLNLNVTSETGSVARESLPGAISDLILPDASDVTVRSVVFKGGDPGYSVSFKSSKSLQATDTDLKNAFSKWRSVAGVRTYVVSMMERVTDKYNARSIETLNQDLTTQVIILASIQ